MHYDINTSLMGDRKSRDKSYTGNPAYLHHLIHNCLPASSLPSSHKLLLTVPRMASYNYRSAELLSTFERSLKTELFDIASCFTGISIVSQVSSLGLSTYLDQV